MNTDNLADQKGSKEAMGYGIGGQQSNTDGWGDGI